MRLPLLLSVPHGGLEVPPEVSGICLLTVEDIIADGDDGARDVYALESEVAGFVAADVARAIVDLNRAPDDRGRDGVVKTHTCWDVPIYAEPLSEELAERLLADYYCPYHNKLTELASAVVLGLDCHTMAAIGPPIGPDPGAARPAVCLSNADGTCPDAWMHSLAACLERSLGFSVSINNPFKGGYTIRRHASEIPWMQVELSRAPFMSWEEKRERILAALGEWCIQEGFSA